MESIQFDPSRIEGPRFMVKITEISKTPKKLWPGFPQVPNVPNAQMISNLYEAVKVLFFS